MNYKLNDMAYLTDDCDGHFNKRGKIIKIKPGPFNKGESYDIIFDDGYILPDVLPYELSSTQVNFSKFFNMTYKIISNTGQDSLKLEQL